MKHDKFPGNIGRTVADSTPWWPAGRNHKQLKPNILVVLLDDTGWADFGCFGSEIRTATIDRLAARGLRYTNFHVTPLCSPTRTCLLTGRNHHAVGMRFLSDTDTGFPNSRGSIDEDVALLPAMLREHGYGSYLVGKWHLTPAHEISPAGPYHNWPLGRGFDRFYGFLPGCTDQMTPELCEDNHQVERDFPEGYHLTEDLVDRAIAYVRDHTVFRDEEPFFLQLAFGATHAPFQAPRSFIEPYVDVFAKGWDATREDRLRRQKELGIAPAGAELAPRNEEVAAWASLSGDQKRLYAHLQAAYAGFLEHTDTHLGRLVDELERLGELDNTLVIILSDNGASREGGKDGAVDTNAPYSGLPQPVEEQLKHLDRIGTRHGGAHYPQGWAMAGNTPFRRYKQHVDLGGVRSPMVVSWPKGIAAAGEVRAQFSHVIDLAPTIMSLAGLEHPLPCDGRSLASTFDDAEAPAPRATQYWENLGHRAIWHEGWRAVTEHRQGVDYDDDDWRLYDTETDFSEAHDRAGEEPELLREMVGRWWQEAEANNVLPLDDRTLVQLLRARPPMGLMSRRSLVFRPGQSHIPISSMVTGSERSMRVIAAFRDRMADEGGVLVSSGDSRGGYVLYVRHGRLVFEHVQLGERTICIADVELPAGIVEAGFVLHARVGHSAEVVLLQGGMKVGAARIPTTAAHLSFWGLDVGSDTCDRVSSAYPADFSYRARSFETLTVDFLEQPLMEDVAEAMESTE